MKSGWAEKLPKWQQWLLAIIIAIVVFASLSLIGYNNFGIPGLYILFNLRTITAIISIVILGVGLGYFRKKYSVKKSSQTKRILDILILIILLVSAPLLVHYLVFSDQSEIYICYTQPKTLNVDFLTSVCLSRHAESLNMTKCEILTYWNNRCDNQDWTLMNYQVICDGIKEDYNAACT